MESKSLDHYVPDTEPLSLSSWVARRVPGDLETKKVYNTDSDRGRTLKVPVRIGDQAISATIDSAAQVTVLKTSLVEQCIKSQPVDTIRLVGISQNSIIGDVFSNVKIQIGQQLMTGNVVSAPIKDDILLGIDFLLGMKVRIDFGTARVVINDEVIQAQIITDSGAEDVCDVSLAHDVQVPPCSVKSVSVLLTRNFESGFCVTPLRENFPCMIPSSFHNSSKDVVIQLFNDTSKTIRIKKGTVVGVAESGEEKLEPSQTSGSSRVRKVETSRSPTSQLPEHLTELFQRSSTGLDANQIQEVKQLLIDFQDIFSSHDLDIGSFDLISHRIPLLDPNVEPVKERIRRTPMGFEGEEAKHLNKMLDLGVIEPSESAWASAPVLIRKKDGSVRWCLDYRKLNNLTRKDAFPLPLITDCLDALAGNRYMSTLDMASGYWQIQMHPEDKDKTAFITKYGLFEFSRMPFGLTNAPSTFQRAVNLVLRGLTWKTVLAFLDDILVLGSDFKNHLENLKVVFRRLRQHNLKLKPKKCVLFRMKAKFLGKIVSYNSVEVDPESLETIKKWPIPTTTKEVESFLGFVNYHREHLPNLAELSIPLYALTGKNPFKWTESCQDAFNKIKEHLLSPEVLAMPQNEGQFILDTDASNEAIGGCLSQVQNGEVKPISFSSKRLTPPQRKYCTTRKELLALVVFTRQFRHYLLGRKFLIRTDHNSLTWLMRFKDIEGQLARWMEELAQYDMNIIHRRGIKHTNADVLSRLPDELVSCDCYRAGQDITSLPCGGCTYCARATKQWGQFEEDVDDVVPLATKVVSRTTIQADANWTQVLSKAEWIQGQNEDKDFLVVKEWLKLGKEVSREELFSKSLEVKKLWAIREHLRVEEDILKYQWVGGEDLIVVPYHLRHNILKLAHENILAGHFGIQKTDIKIRTHFFWPGLKADVETFVKGCAACNKSKPLNKKPLAPLKEFTSGAPMEKVHLDILGPLPCTKNNNVYILLIVDQFTKWVEAVALPNQKAETVARATVENFILRLGCPLEIITDQGTNFQSDLFQELCRLLEIAKKRTTPYHPSANGQVERLNRVILQMLRCVIQEKQDTWDTKLPYLLAAIRSTENRSTGFTPNKLMLGREVQTPLTLMLGEKSPFPSSHEYNRFMNEELRRCYQLARDSLGEQQVRQKKQRDPKVHLSKFETGDVVFLVNSATKIGVSKKLQPCWQGPFLIIKVVSPILFEIASRKKNWVVHHDRLKKCTDRSMPLWLRRRRHNLFRGTLKTAPAASDGAPKYCICRGVDNGSFMIACDGWDDWFHGDCVGITRRMARDIHEYFCVRCRRV